MLVSALLLLHVPIAPSAAADRVFLGASTLHGFLFTQQQGGYSQPRQSQGGYGGQPQSQGGYSQGGMMSGDASRAQAAAPAIHLHMAGTTAADAVGSGGGPPAAEGSPAPGYVQAKYVMPSGSSTVFHHYANGMPPPLGEGGPNDGNPANSNYIANGTVAGNPGLVNWGTLPAYEREEAGNWAGLGNQASANPLPYIGGFND